MDLVTVLKAILTSRQPREKLQCLHEENVMSNNLSKTAVLKKKMNCKLKLQQRILLTNFGVVNVLKFLQTLVLDFPYICLQYFPGNFKRREEKFLQTQKNKKLF